MPGRAKKRTTVKENGADDDDNEVKKSPSKKAKPSTVESVKFRIEIEHWATAVADALREKYGEVQIDLNPSAPRRGSFECKVIKEDGTEHLVWTGIKKGPPRKLKFPEDPDLVVKEIEKAL